MASKGVHMAVMAGFSAACASIFAKTAASEDGAHSVVTVLSALAKAVSIDLHRLLFSHDGVVLTILLVRFIGVIGIFVSNAVMWIFFSKSLQLCSSSVVATVTNTAANFMLTCRGRCYGVSDYSSTGCLYSVGDDVMVCQDYSSTSCLYSVGDDVMVCQDYSSTSCLYSVGDDVMVCQDYSSTSCLYSVGDDVMVCQDYSSTGCLYSVGEDVMVCQDYSSTSCLYSVGDDVMACQD
ncbi:hypothetical protein BaRGS_00027097 [Batillaria attramentaria]|uniref:Uncharacterized protein n=1 Tax=Batillaria attramentaria TaxID=370345 RepID=A0ABD0K3U8_9CAEN